MSKDDLSFNQVLRIMVKHEVSDQQNRAVIIFISLVYFCSVTMLGTICGQYTMLYLQEETLYITALFGNELLGMFKFWNCSLSTSWPKASIYLTHHRLYAWVVSSFFECLNVMIPEDGCDLNKLLGHTFLPFPRKTNKSLSWWTGSQTVSIAISKRWADVVKKKFRTEWQTRKPPSYNVVSQYSRVLLTQGALYRSLN